MGELATERKLIFTNLLNGVPLAEVAQAFNKQSEAEVVESFRFVALKIRGYIFQRAMPHVPCDTVAEAMQNRLLLMGILEKLNLETLPAFAKITDAPLEEFIA